MNQAIQDQDIDAMRSAVEAALGIEIKPWDAEAIVARLVEAEGAKT